MKLALLITAALFSAFIVNVTLGAFGGTPILGDVGEMLLLLAASVTFVIAILEAEAAAKDKKRQSDNPGRTS